MQGFLKLILPRSRSVVLLTSALTVASLFGFAGSSYAASASTGIAQCSLGTLNGTYVFSDSGFNVLGSNHIPFADAGHETFDGNGNVHGVFTQSVNGTITRLIHYVGKYTIAQDCTGTETFTDNRGVTAHFDQFITPDGRQFTYTETDPRTVLASTLEVRA